MFAAILSGPGEAPLAADLPRSSHEGFRVRLEVQSAVHLVVWFANCARNNHLNPELPKHYQPSVNLKPESKNLTYNVYSRPETL